MFQIKIVANIAFFIKNMLTNIIYLTPTSLNSRFTNGQLKFSLQSIVDKKYIGPYSELISVAAASKMRF